MQLISWLFGYQNGAEMNHRGYLKGPDAVIKTWPDITQASQFDFVASFFYIKEKEKKIPSFACLV